MLIRIALCLLLSGTMYSQSFIEVSGTELLRDGVPYHFVGFNFWYGMHLAAQDPDRLKTELDLLVDLGVTNLRIMASSEGPDTAPWRVSPSLQPEPGVFREDLLQGFDLLLVELAKRDMVAVVCLNNFWPWSGGMAQYLAWARGDSIPYPPPAEGGDWLKYMNYTAGFYSNEEAMQLAEANLKKIILRKNSISGQLYVDDPTIMSWQLANEPRGMFKPRKYRKWLRKTARLIKSLDQNHLVSLGSEGNTHVPTGNNFRKDHKIPEIDYLTIHIWIQNWGWYDPVKPTQTFQKSLDKAKKYLDRHLATAKKLNKPLILEEFGIARDGGSYDVVAKINYRNQYYEAVLEWLVSHQKVMAGCNIWAWGGQGRPRSSQCIWQVGDDLIGDPPHEYQGWYSVYDSDTTTHRLILKYNTLFKNRK